MKTHRLGIVFVAMLAGVTLSPVSRAEETTAAAAAPEAALSNYVGTWNVQDGKGRAFTITLEAGGKAASKWAQAEEQRRNDTGTWQEVDGSAVITWANGWREVIAKSGEGYVKKAFAPKLKLDGKPSNEAPATKAAAMPAP